MPKQHRKNNTMGNDDANPKQIENIADKRKDDLITNTRPYLSASFPHSNDENIRPNINDDAMNPA